MLKLQLGPPGELRPGAPNVPGEGRGQDHGPQHQPHQRHTLRRGPAARARDAARRATWLQKKQDSQQKPPAAVTIGDDDNVPLETLESSTKPLIYQSGLRNLFMKNLLHCPKKPHRNILHYATKDVEGITLVWII